MENLKLVWCSPKVYLEAKGCLEECPKEPEELYTYSIEAQYRESYSITETQMSYLKDKEFILEKPDENSKTWWNYTLHYIGRHKHLDAVIADENSMKKENVYVNDDLSDSFDIVIKNNKSFELDFNHNNKHYRLKIKDYEVIDKDE